MCKRNFGKPGAVRGVITQKWELRTYATTVGTNTNLGGLWTDRSPYVHVLEESIITVVVV